MTTPSSLHTAAIVFTVDRAEKLCFVGDAGGVPVWLRLDPAFPDRPAWTVTLPDGRTWALEELPDAWTTPPAPWEWPDTARPAPVFDFWD